MTSLEILKAARDLITDRKHWTTRAYFRDKNGECCSLRDDTYSYCLSGALMKASVNLGAGLGEDYGVSSKYMWEATRQATGFYEIPSFANDQGGHDVVLSILDRAIEICEKDS